MYLFLYFYYVLLLYAFDNIWFKTAEKKHTARQCCFHLFQHLIGFKIQTKLNQNGLTFPTFDILNISNIWLFKYFDLKFSQNEMLKLFSGLAYDLGGILTSHLFWILLGPPTSASVNNMRHCLFRIIQIYSNLNLRKYSF